MTGQDVDVNVGEKGYWDVNAAEAAVTRRKAGG